MTDARQRQLERAQAVDPGAEAADLRARCRTGDYYLEPQSWLVSLRGGAAGAQ